MQTIIWTFCSMVVLILVVSFLPLGYTLKGKYLIVLMSFILSLSGLIAIPVFKVWQTLSMLFAFSFFVAYFMNNRLGRFLYKAEHLVENEYSFPNNINENSKMEIKDFDRFAIPKSFRNENELSPLVSIGVSLEDKDIDINEEAPFWLEGDFEIETYVPTSATNLDENYLGERLFELALEKEEESVSLEDDTLKEFSELPVILGEQMSSGKNESREAEILDDSLFNFLLTKDEVANGLEEELVVINWKK